MDKPPVFQITARQQRRNARQGKRMIWLGMMYHRLSMPLSVYFLFSSRRFNPHYRMNRRRRWQLGNRMYRNWRKVPTGISYKAHLAMAAKLLEIPPSVKGSVVECGCWMGGTSVNLSVMCEVVDRNLIVYDSFEGLPTPAPGDNLGENVAGGFCGSLDTVMSNVEKFGDLQRCEFRKGWFQDTLPSHSEPIVLCFIDVDLHSSMHDCVVNLWGHLTNQGYLFFDDYTHLDNCALFFSERFWHDYLNTKPPGLMGSGTGIGVGQYYVGPWPGNSALQRPTSTAYTRKDFIGTWSYAPESGS